jgi:hypothetical protein
MRSVVVLALAALGCGSGTAHSEAGIHEAETAVAYPAAALLDAHAGGIVGECSAAIVAPRVVLTAGHCVHDFSGFTVTAPYAVNAPARASSHAETFDWNVPGDAPSPALHDVGLVYLEEPVHLDAYPSLVRAPLESGVRVRYIGRVSDGAVSRSDLFVGSAHAVRPGADYGWPHTYATSFDAEPGDSGGPAVLADSDGMVIAGVDSGSNRDLDVALFARIDELAAWIDERIAAHAEPAGER